MYKNDCTKYKWFEKLGRHPGYRVVMINYVCRQAALSETPNSSEYSGKYKTCGIAMAHMWPKYIYPNRLNRLPSQPTCHPLEVQLISL